MQDNHVAREVLSAAEAAKYLGVSKSLLDKNRCSGKLKLPFTRIGRRVVYLKQDLNAFLESQRRIHVSES
jgi:excisionase family DNA binding protein